MATEKIIDTKNNTCKTHSFCQQGHLIIALIIVMATLANISANWWISQSVVRATSNNAAALATKSTDRLEAIGTLQFGSADNYALYQKLQYAKSPQIKQQILSELSKEGVDVSDLLASQTGSTEPVVLKKLTDEQYTALFANSYTEGAAGAKITIAEFSDLECPACIYHHGQGVTKALLKTYSNDVNYILRPVVLANHPDAIPKSFAALCVGKIAGTNAFIEFYNSIFTNSATTVTPLSSLTPLALKLKVDATKFKKCYEGRETEAAFNAVRELSNALKINATPTTLVVNNATKEYVSVRGAADAASFEKEINAMLGK